jgi:putative aldouronate transport system permease protein
MKTGPERSRSMDRRTFADFLIGAGMLVYSLLCLYPFYYILIYSISDPNLVVRGVFLLPAGFSIENYVHLFRQNNILHAAFISLSRSSLGSVMTVFFTSLFSFILIQDVLRFRKFLYRIVVVTMYVSATLIPWYLLMTRLGFKNNFLLYIVPSAINAFYLILIKTYMESIPGSLQESALIDGAGAFRIFASIILPVCKPISATVLIFAAVDQWNTWTDNFYLANIPILQTLQMLLLSFLVEQSSFVQSAMAKSTMKAPTVTPTSIRMAITMIVTFPVLLVYPIFQRYFVKGIMLGAIKG